MTEYITVTLRERPEMTEQAADWFHAKWRVPRAAYMECMEAYLKGETEYGWYLCLCGEEIAGGLGVIENDFHARKDLTPNVCAVYTEAAHRGKGVAGRLLHKVVQDMEEKGISPLYLLTDHSGFYERYGWEFLCMVQGDGEPEPSRMYIHRGTKTETEALFEKEQTQAYEAAKELCEKAFLKAGQIVVVGCSTSEIGGRRIGTDSNPALAEAVFKGIMTALDERGIYLAAQCCEHLNRAIVTEAEAVPGQETVNVIPRPKAGGSFATLAYEHFQNPVVVEEIRADAGMDIGETLIGMHLKKVAVPLRLEYNQIGMAHVTAARTRPRFIGGERAVYDKSKM